MGFGSDGRYGLVRGLSWVFTGRARDRVARILYYPYMPSIVGKRRGTQTYYYLVESARVDGKPRIVAQEYLGTAEEVTARLAGADAGVPDRTQHKRFGDVAAAWSVIQELDVAAVVDQVTGPRRSEAAASVGTYIALSVLNRVVDPCSKAAFADWWATTCGPRLVKVPAAALDHRRFWGAMDTLSEADLAEIESRLVRTTVSRFALDPAALVLDMTTFATFVDSTSTQAPLAQRGRAKQKRNDLRLVGLGLVVTRDGGIPLVSHAYPGNRPDVTQFATMRDTLTARYGDLLGDPPQATVVFDAGQNSTANFAHLDRLGLHFVGSLPPSDHPALLERPAADRHVVDTATFGGLTAVEARAHTLGADRRVVLTHSPTLAGRQRTGFAQTLATATGQLDELAATLERGKTRRGRQAVQAEIDRIVKPRWVNRVLVTDLTGTDPPDLRLSWRVDPTAHADLETEIFGKRVLVTDHEDWPVTDVVAAYRSQAEVESGFRQMKDLHVVSFSPMHHWTDQKIRVHVLTCVLALVVAHLMRRTAARAGQRLSVRELLAQLEGIQETVLLHQADRGRPRARRMITDMTPHQQHLYKIFDLGRYAPKR